ncbi:hypothetical protein MTO96_026842 [Rhipicephalus appendiculatus]
MTCWKRMKMPADAIRVSIERELGSANQLVMRNMVMCSYLVDRPMKELRRQTRFLYYRSLNNGNHRPVMSADFPTKDSPAETSPDAPVKITSRLSLHLVSPANSANTASAGARLVPVSSQCSPVRKGIGFCNQCKHL